MVCKKGQYYETAIDQCRSCDIPCKLSKELCRTMGCKGYQKLIDLRRNAQSAAMPGVQTSHLKQSAPKPKLNLSVKEAPNALALGLAGSAIFQSCTLVLIGLIVGIVILIRRRKKNGKTEGKNNNDNEKQQHESELKLIVSNTHVDAVQQYPTGKVLHAVQEVTPHSLREESPI